MQLQSLFANDINRNIETVIKADDTAHVFQEVHEYVVTNEIAKKITPFFEAYTDYAGANGVWISGFFGSGKSHLLKMLSYVLEDREHDGQKLSELFAQKIEDQLLRGNVQRAMRLPAESILFNIDNKAEVASKDQPDAVLSVFYRVFYEHLGFFGTKAHVGDFEFWLWEEGKYDDFWQRFNAASDRSWQDARRQYFLPQVKKITGQVLSELFNGQAEEFDEVLKTFQQDHTKVIDDFCTKVLKYIQSKPSDFRLNFFVDEIGQYISDNTKLMLNLQTIAETLAVQSNGQAWIFVTSQQDIEGVMGELKDSARNDFSRIQDRFRNRISLTSASVDEVIEKRLLAKQEKAVPKLTTVWQEEEANLATILRFEDIGIQLRSYRGEQDFVQKYPFVHYQFDLFQSCIRALSAQGAFEGKHASVGERSMLGVFKQVLMDMQDGDMGVLVPFDRLFEGIRSTIKSEMQAAVTMGEKNLDSQMAVRALKALFMVKYFQQFQPTLRNVGVLLIDSVRPNIKEHEEAVEEALNVLEQQVYVQRNGDVYEFLTNEEKDIEREIQQTDIEPGSVSSLIGTIIFDDILKDNRLRYEDNKQDYRYMRMVDEQRLSGREQELILEIITPDFPEYDQPTQLANRAMGENTKAVFVLPANKRLIPDCRMYLKTERYLRHNKSTNITPRKQLIHQQKGQQNTERYRKLIEVLRRELGKATVYLGTGKLELTPTESGENLVAKAFQSLVATAYPRLSMLGTAIFSEETVKNILRNPIERLFSESGENLSEAEGDVLTFITRRTNQHERTNVQDVIDKYARKPYGWYDYATLSILARLLKRNKLDMFRGTDVLAGDALQGGLLNSRQRTTVVLEPQRSFDPGAVRDLQQLYRELFDKPCPEQDARAVAQAFRQKLEQDTVELKGMLREQDRYPFLQQLEEPIEQYDRIRSRKEDALLENPKGFADDLLDAKEDYIAPIRQFMNGEQKRVYDSIRDFRNGDISNLKFVEQAEALSIIDRLLDATQPYRGNQLRDAKAAMNQITEAVLEQLKQERTEAIRQIEAERDRLAAYQDFKKLSAEQQEALTGPFSAAMQSVKEERYIFQIRQLASQASEQYVHQFNRMQELLDPEPSQAADSGADTYEDGAVKSPKPKTKRLVTARQINLPDAPRQIDSEEVLEQYLSALRQAYREELAKGHIINL